MMLILEIALGIVLGVLILNNLGSILTAGALIALAAIVIALIGALLYWVSGSTITLGVLLFCAIVSWLYYISREKVATHEKINDLKNKIEKRVRNGYDVTELQTELDLIISNQYNQNEKDVTALKSKLPFKVRLFSSAAKREKLHRKALGYDD